MSQKSKTLPSRRPTVLKQDEFNIFLEIMSDPGSAPYLHQIAESLGVARETLSEWNKRPEVQKAKKDAASRYLASMETVGMGDWKMWKEKLNMLGLTVVQKTDVTSGGEKITPIFGGVSVSTDNRDPQSLQSAPTD